MPARWRRLTALAVLGAILLGWPGMARALWGDSQGAAGLDGSLRTLGFWSANQPALVPGSPPADTQAVQTLLRLVLAGQPSDRLGYEVHLLAAHTYQAADLDAGQGLTASGGGATPAPGLRYRALDLSRQATWPPHHQADLGLDRLNLSLGLGWGDLTLGRQAISFGKAWFWNPLDIFLPFDPSQFDRDYKPGVDAARLEVPLGSFSGLTLVAAAGRRLDGTGAYVDADPDLAADWPGSALLARAYGNLAGWDLSAQGGKIYGGWQLGGGAVRDLGDIVQIRAEAAQFWSTEATSLPWPYGGPAVPTGWQLVLGAGRHFENSLDIQAEYFHNGLGDQDDLGASLLRLGQATVLSLGEDLAGMVASYEFHPLVTGQLSLLANLADASWQLQPSLTLSLGDNATLLAGVSVNQGDAPALDANGAARPRSEFGTYGDLYFLEIKYYF